MFLALPQDQYLVSAGASIRRRRHAKVLRCYFQGSGTDDRQDHIEWFVANQRKLGSAIEITVVDTAQWMVPSRRRRKTIDWDKLMARQRENDLKRLELYRTLLARMRAGLPSKATQPREASLAFEVSLNGKRLGSFAVEDPGALTVTVVVKQRASGQVVKLHLHGGTQLDDVTWRWYQWRWTERKLRVNDKVRIRLVTPRGTSPRKIRDISGPPSTAAEIARELKALSRRVRSSYYTKEAAIMRAVMPERLPPRRYSRP